MFKVCTSCQKNWERIEEFLSDPHLQFVGYQSNFKDPKNGIFLFNHSSLACQTTLSLRVEMFRSLSSVQLAFDSFVPHQSDACKGYCAKLTELRDCENESCQGRSIRQLIVKIVVEIENYKKSTRANAS